ncbi:TonB-dependent receptor [Halovibrio salipaludis]|nr:TonB-dependent receptor [Halovibrio salipaludis]
MTAQAQSETGMTLDPVVVSATRSETSVSETARSVTVVDEDQINEQSKVSRNLNDILAQTVPGLGPSTESVTNYGQTLRGRKFLVLIDGIPQSTPLRDASRGLNSISASAIERIEVIRGGTAIYGFGAKGGVINVITKKASEDSVSGYSQAGVRFSTEHFDDSLDYETEHRVSGTQGDWDYVLSGSFVERGGRFDADGDRIPPGGPGGTQGGFSDTTEYNVLAKTGLDFDGGDQRIELMVNEFNNEQDSDYTFGFAQGDDKTPAVPLDEAVDQAKPGVDPEQVFTSARATYSHADIAGSSIKADVYYGDSRQAFPKYYYPGAGPYPQSAIESEKVGVRTSVNTPLEVLADGANLTWGVDYLSDKTDSRYYDQSGEIPATSPAMDQDAYAGYAQLELPVAESAVLRAGLRHEDISVDVGTVPANGSSFPNLQGHRVESGTLDYSETLFNLGAVYFVSDSVDLFASYSEGFSIADVGRVIRDAGPYRTAPSDPILTFQAGSFESEAEKVENYEIGSRYSGERLGVSAAVFYSASNGGTTFDSNLNIQKNDEDIWGVETAADYSVTSATTLGGTLTWAEGIRDTADGGRKRLPGTRIAPLKVTGYLEDQTLSWWHNRLQLSHIGSRDQFEGSTAFGEGEVERYTIIDYVARFNAGSGEVTLSVRNLLNEDYYPAVSQSYYQIGSANSATSRIKGQGRTMGVGYSLNW